MNGKIGVTMKYGTILPRAKLLQRLGREISAQASLRLKWMDWYFAHGKNKRLTARHFGISPTSFYKWFRRYSALNYFSLENKSRAPLRQRRSEIPFSTIKLVIKLRRENMGLSKYKLNHILKRDYQILLSASSINRILKERGLIEEARLIKGVKRRRVNSYKIPRLRVERALRYLSPGSLVQVDTKHLNILGAKYYQFTAIDTKTRFSFSRVYSSISSSASKDFLTRLIKQFPFKIKAVQTDNGSEYLLYFHAYCKEKGIAHYFSRPRTPKDNALVERFIQTTEQELWLFDETLIPEVKYLNQQLYSWTGRYLNYRPHQALAYMTPFEYYELLKVKQTKVSTM